ncbi:3-dehydroquinate synthase [Clavibacter michiganensis subsp. michiganensis]|nr:3-dehydroquinate synthase [Clavibacter michiganensis subsp. michiganensis]
MTESIPAESHAAGSAAPEPAAATVIRVSGTPGYDVTVGRGLVQGVGALLGPRVRKVLIVHAPALAEEASRLRERLQGDVEVYLAEVPDAEGAKRVEVAAFCWKIMGTTDFTRSDAVITLGGGATTDLGGFVAATWLRGVMLIQIPTTVLAMVDAAVGGKTGINTSEGKNLVGAFYAPTAVIVDLDLLATLPRNEIVTGFAEIVKAGFIAVPEILDVIERDVARVTDPTTPEFRRVVELSIAMKAEVVGRTSPRRAAARSSTTATRSATPSSTPSATAGGTARPSRWAWCSPLSSRASRARCPTRRSTGTGGSSTRSTCPPATPSAAGPRSSRA